MREELWTGVRILVREIIFSHPEWFGLPRCR